MRTALISLVLITATAHAQFTLQNSNSTADLRGIHSVGNGVAWASGTNGTVLRTEDGGYVWQSCSIPPGAEKLDFRGIQAFDANTAIVMSSGPGDQSRLYKTTDGCHSWKLIFTNPDKDGFWDALKFDSQRTGILIGDPVKNQFPIFTSINKGETWSRVDHVSPYAGIKKAGDRWNESMFAASNSTLLVFLAPRPHTLLQIVFLQAEILARSTTFRALTNQFPCSEEEPWCPRPFPISPTVEPREGFPSQRDPAPHLNC